MNARAIAALGLGAMAILSGTPRASGAAATYTIYFQVTGLQGQGLQLTNNATDKIAVTADGINHFATQLAADAGYKVEVAQQPASQACSVANGIGKVAAADVTNVSVTCAAQSPATFPSSGEALGPGDKLIALECIPEFLLPGNAAQKFAMPPMDTKMPATDTKVPPRNTHVTTTFWVDTGPDSKGNVAGHFVLTASSHWNNLWHLFGLLNRPIEGMVAAPSCSLAANEVTPPAVEQERQYVVSTTALDSYATRMAGAVYGALTIPYKYHISAGKLDAAPTVAAFIGVHVANPGIDIAWILAGGLGSVTVPTVGANGQASSDLKASVTLATGPVFTLSKGQRFQVGLLFGTDVTGKTTPEYAYNGKLWVAFSLGVALTK